MTKVQSFKDFLYISQCYKTLHQYKDGEIDERRCLILIAENFEEMEK